MAEQVLAAVRTGPSKTEIREYPMPDIPEDAALMKMEVGGICGTDVKLYKHPPSNAPTIMGHENIGIIAKAGRIRAELGWIPRHDDLREIVSQALAWERKLIDQRAA